MRILIIVALCAASGGCAIERAAVAQQAQGDMVGLSKEQVLTCMGPPMNKAAEGATEAWAYSTHPTHLDSDSPTRYCTVTVLLTGGRVSAVRYQGPTGGLLAQGEQCAYAVAACVKPHG
jgi:hypothetical protein